MDESLADILFLFEANYDIVRIDKTENEHPAHAHWQACLRLKKEEPLSDNTPRVKQKPKPANPEWGKTGHRIEDGDERRV